MFLKNWLRDLQIQSSCFFRRLRARARRRRPSNAFGSFVPAIERMEERVYLSVITVTSLSDDTLANLAGDGEISLREAIEAAETDTSVDGSVAGSGADTIVFDPALTQNGSATLLLKTVGDDSYGPSAFAVSSNITIQGPNDKDITLSRLNTVTNLRHFIVLSGGSLTLENLNIANGRAESYGGAILTDGARSLTVNNSVFLGNQVSGNGEAFDGRGGGIRMFGGQLDVNRSKFLNNSAPQSGGAIDTFALGFEINIVDSTFASNMAFADAGEGGAIRNAGCDLTVTGSSFFDNTAGFAGGAIQQREGNMQIANSTFEGNNREALSNYRGTLLVTNTTVSGSSIGIGNGDLTIIENSTITNNQFAIRQVGFGTTRIKTSILANSAESNIDFYGGLIESQGNNLIDDDSLVPWADVTDLHNTDPMLGPLTSNGGPTLTYALLPGSPAINAGSLVDPPENDQRGFARDDRPDIGAYEFILDISIDDVTISEGDEGVDNAVLTVTLSRPDPQQLNVPVTVNYHTENGTATAGSDFENAIGTITFPPGQSTQTIIVPVNGDLVHESDETFDVRLTDASIGNIVDDLGEVTILDDNDAHATVESIVIDDGSAQRSMITSITVTFSDEVTLGNGAFELTNQDGVSFALDVTNPSDDGKTFVLSFSGAGIIGGSLPDGIYTLTIHSNSIFDSFGKTLDGDGDGINGGDNATTFRRLFGDSDGDGDVDASDQALFNSAFRSELGTEDYLRIFDFDGDGDIDQLDRGEFNQRYSSDGGSNQNGGGRGKSGK